MVSISKKSVKLLGYCLPAIVLAAAGIIWLSPPSSISAAGEPLTIGANVTFSSSYNLTSQKFIDTGSASYFLDPNATDTSLTVAGNVGIGTTSPGALLHLYSLAADVNPKFETDKVDGLIQLQLFNDARNWNIKLDGADSDKFKIRDVTAGLDRLVIDTSGNVGIGTTAPANLLNVSGTADGTSLITTRLDNTGTSANTTVGMVFWTGSGNKASIIASAPTTGQEGVLGFFTRPTTGALAERMRIDEAGNVGIGTTVPLNKLQITGASDTEQLRVAGSGSYNAYQGLAFSYGNTARTGAIRSRYTNGDATTETYISFHANLAGSSNDTLGTEVMRLVGSGNVGIGTTAPGTKLDVQGGIITASGGFNGPCLTLVSNAFSTNTGRNCNRDIAEVYKTSEDVESGDVLVTDANNPLMLKKSSSSYDPALVGVVTTSPGLILGVGPENDEVLMGGETALYSSKPENRRKPAIALAGKVPVKIAPSSESIKAGDYLTSSDTPGKAMKAIRAGATVGKALENWTSNSGKTSILISLNASWYDPTDTAKVIKEQQDEIDQLKTRLEKLEILVSAGSSR